MIISDNKIFDPIKLEDTNQVKLMNRLDKKYWIHASELPGLLASVKNDYFALEIEGKWLLPYSTTYYDTKDKTMYHDHHNGKLNRIKIRKRCYVISGTCFLEVKIKTNKGRTIKKRIATDFNMQSFSDLEKEFIETVTPYSIADLQPTLINKFTRITLVNKNFKERTTIDLDLSFKEPGDNQKMNNLVVIEIKTDASSGDSSIEKSLKAKRIKTSSFSKYCVGLAYTNLDVKQNRFKAKIRSLNKLILPT